MKKTTIYLLSCVLLFLVSCASSNSITTVAKGNDVSKYKYVVFGNEDDGDAELADILMLVQKEKRYYLPKSVLRLKNGMEGTPISPSASMITVQIKA